MYSAPKKNTKKANISNRAVEDGDSLKKDLDAIIKKTEEQNRALIRIMIQNHRKYI